MSGRKRQPGIDRRFQTMKGTFHGPVGPNPNWLDGRRIIYLSVPFADRCKVNALGAKWNSERRRWWVFADVDPSPFLKWLPDQAKPADMRQEKALWHDIEAERYQRLNDERRAKWRAVYPDQPWPGDAPEGKVY